ncbi:MAG: division/cell wall cluster transcriptional repressor MraZ [Chitinophagaceae bacterium]|jgi:MraZ protein|nr:division/cell wall cluster transcriptional repressor MraZ [Chitinophagales bacterium]MBX9893221.1 division/cell wall cluster transcriptional repressor MraZ [Chitinophagaceae bacterium]HAK12667.1 division/cell wall cluster transcriptional repressor MraZ [Chitinophagaceae bacterium]HCT21915.1 division/cell wall cluster transcriptional repressor MraZ [Chitinophagaceae bacterium]
MIGFLGEYEATVDAKGRFLLPAGFKKQLTEGENRFIISRGFEKCLTLYPMKSWEPIMNKINQLNDFDPKVREFRRQFLGGATEIELDAAGRLLLPPTLKEFAGLSKDIILVAALDKIEIWDAGKYKQLFEDFSPEAFSNLAQDVMTKKDDAPKS